MLRKSPAITLLLLTTSLFLLTGCPPPSDIVMWQRANTDQDGVRMAMGKCGVQVTGPDMPKTDNESVLYFQCMEKMGFTRKDGFEICSVRVFHNTAACRQQELGHPLSQRQLEALPFVADRGFHPVKPDSGVILSSLISWRKAGASLHYSHEIENDKEALAQMYQCGYPQPLGSPPDVPTLLKAAQVQRCMLDNGFKPKNELNLVCRNYPQVTGCPSQR